jgi:hypothetical protein
MLASFAMDHTSELSDTHRERGSDQDGALQCTGRSGDGDGTLWLLLPSND